jgi:hypothetical protein
MGWLTHVPNPGPHEKGAHFEALKKAERHPLFKAADWAAVWAAAGLAVGLVVAQVAAERDVAG